MTTPIIDGRGISFTHHGLEPPPPSRALMAAAPTYVSLPSWPPVVPVQEDHLIAVVNAHRSTLKLSQLAKDSRLAADAEWKSDDQVYYLYQDHDQPPGTVPGVAGATTVFDRFAAFGLAGFGWGECIGYGFLSAEAVVAAWLSDEGHRAIVEGDSWTHIGCGTATAPAGDPSANAVGVALSNPLTWWTLDVAAISNSPTPTPTPTPTPVSKLVGAWRQNDPPHHVIQVLSVHGSVASIRNPKGVATTMQVAKLRRLYTQVPS